MQNFKTLYDKPFWEKNNNKRDEKKTLLIVDNNISAMSARRCSAQVLVTFQIHNLFYSNEYHVVKQMTAQINRKRESKFKCTGEFPLL